MGLCSLREQRHTSVDGYSILPDASLAISAGAVIKVVQKLLGHKSAVVTLNRYSHLFPDDLDAVATAFEPAAEGPRTVPALNVVAGARTPSDLLVAGTGFEPVQSVC
jgi:hypothetical protein